MKDKEDYTFERGLYIEIDELPGSISYNMKDLLKNLSIPITDYLNSYKINIEISLVNIVNMMMVIHLFVQ